MLELELARLGMRCWVDNKAEDLTRAVSPLPIHLISSFDCRVVHAGDARGRCKDQLLPALPEQGDDGPALRAGEHSHLAQVSAAQLHFLQFELRTAIELGKKIVLVHGA